MRAVGQCPPGFLLGGAVGVNAQPRSRRQFFNAGNQGARGRDHGVEVQVVVQRDRVEHRVNIAAFKQGGQGGGKAQAFAGA